MSHKLSAGRPMPELDVALVEGGHAHIGGPRDGFQLVVVYRGRHCSICKRYLGELQAVAAEIRAANAELLVVSGDPLARARADVDEQGWTFPVGYDLSREQMRALGLYISEPRSSEETDRPFAEPAAFIVNPAGQLQVACLSNAPWVRPEPTDLLYAIGRIQAIDYPIRGTLD